MGKGDFLPQTRFLMEVVTMVAYNSWPGLELPVFKSIPLSMYKKLFTQNFWDQELQKWGPEAMKIWPLVPPKAYSNWSVFRWKLIELRFGEAARRWMQDVDQRVKFDDENGVLWQWLRQLAILSVEPKACMIRWCKQQRDWKFTDKLLWTQRNDFKAKANQLVAYLQQLYNELHSGQPLPSPTPPIEYGYFREAFAALSGMHRALSHEVSVYHIITVNYHRQTDAKTKTDIQNFYGPNLRDRLDQIHSQIAAECIQFLDVFESTDPTVLLRISSNEQAVDLLDNARRLLREKFVAIQHAIRPVRLSFDANPGAYVFNIQDFPFVQPSSAQDTAKRIEKTAKQQLKKLSGPLMTIAQGWAEILERGERLKDAADGTPDAELNDRLRRTAAFVGAIKQRHDMEMKRLHPPDPNRMFDMLATPGLLQPNQGMPDASMRMQRFNTVSAPGQINTWQTLYAEASGFVPYQDPRTGLTRFYQANIPTEAGPSVNPMAAAQAQAQGQNLVGAFAPGFVPPGGNMQVPGGQFQAPAGPDAAFNGLMQGLANPGNVTGGYPQPGPAGQPVQPISRIDAIRALVNQRGRQIQANPAIAGHVVPSIYNRALQTVAGPNGSGLINNNVPGASNLFGGAAAQNSIANQQMEAVIRQSALGQNPQATLGNMAAQQGGMQGMPGAGLAPANQLYDPVGGNAYQAFQQGQPMYPQQVIPNPQQNPFAPGGGAGPANMFPPPQAPGFPPPGGYQGPNVFRPPQAPPPQGGFQGQQQGGPPQAQFPPQGGSQGPQGQQ